MNSGVSIVRSSVVSRALLAGALSSETRKSLTALDECLAEVFASVDLSDSRPY